MLMTKMLQLIDRNLDNFKGSGCKTRYVKAPCYCKFEDTVSR